MRPPAALALTWIVWHLAWGQGEPQGAFPTRSSCVAATKRAADKAELTSYSQTDPPLHYDKAWPVDTPFGRLGWELHSTFWNQPQIHGSVPPNSGLTDFTTGSGISVQHWTGSIDGWDQGTPVARDERWECWPHDVDLTKIGRGAIRPCSRPGVIGCGGVTSQPWMSPR